MARPATGSVLLQYNGKYAVRFRANGKRRYVTLGGPDEGWDEDRAFERLEEILEEVRKRVWTTPHKTLDELIREVVARGESGDPEQIATAVLAQLSEDVLLEEITHLVKNRLDDLNRRRRQLPKRGKLDLSTRYRVGEAWKPLRNLTAKDCYLIARDRGKFAAELREQGVCMRELGRALEGEQVTTVKGLSSVVVGQVLSGAKYQTIKRKRAA